MGHKRSREIYIDGYGKEYYIDEMETSHILNTTLRLQARLESLEKLRISNSVPIASQDNLDKAALCIRTDIRMLLHEYAERTDAGRCC